MAQRPPGSATLRSFVPTEAKKINDRPEPRSGHGSARDKQPFDLLEPEAGVARSLVELDPRHAVPEISFQHSALHSAHSRPQAGAAAQYRAKLERRVIWLTLPGLFWQAGLVPPST
jgi:hypothetical protein